MANGPTFLAELKRRRVFRVATVYAAAGFVVWQAADIAFPALGLPEWLVTAVVALTLVGFPLALVLAWAYDITPDGVVRTDDGDSESHVVVSRATPRTQRIAAAGGLLVLALAGGAFLAFGGRHGEADAGIDRSIAVLPFANLSGAAENEYFSDGITDEILTQLAKIGELRVISRTSIMSYKGTTLRLGEIADQLDVAHVLEGSVRREGDRVRVSAQLIDARADRHLWAETYDHELTGLFRIQSDIARIHGVRGDADGVVRWLEEARRRHGLLQGVDSDPLLAGVREDARVAALLSAAAAERERQRQLVVPRP